MTEVIQRGGHRDSSNRLGEHGIKLNTPGYKMSGLSPTPQLLMTLVCDIELEHTDQGHIGTLKFVMMETCAK